MNEHLRDRILRKMETLSDERGYQVLDFVEFLESRYAERESPSASTFTRFTEAIEDKLRASKVSAGAGSAAVDAHLGVVARARNEGTGRQRRQALMAIRTRPRHPRPVEDPPV